MATERAEYMTWKDRCASMEREICDLRRRPEPHDETVDYLVTTAETLLNAAKALVEIREKPIETAAD